jgi:outer membrane immunogenic protein
MKQLMLAGVIAGIWSSGALAADLGPYGPPPPYEPVYEPARDMPYGWRGFYIGANAGYGWGNDDHVTLSGPGAAGSFGAYSLDGWFGGGQVGYNAQVDRLVLGVEADIQAADISDGTSGTVSGGGNYFGRARADIDWFSTLRGRVGYAAGPTLLYFTGGLAFADVDSNVSASNGVTSVSMSNDSIETGYTLGGGLEWAFAPSWSLKSEYLYVNLGDQTLTSPGGTFTSANDLDFHTVRVGLNYRF